VRSTRYLLRQFWFLSYDYRSRHCSVGIATGYGLVSPGSIPETENFSLPHNVQTGFAPHPSLLFNRYRGLFPPGVKRQGLEADYSSPSSAKVKARSRLVELYLHSPICLHGIALNWLRPGRMEVVSWGGMRTGRGNRSTRRKPSPATLPAKYRT
jgi:hypothetical protein